MNYIFFIITITNKIVNISKLLISQNNKQEIVLFLLVILNVSKFLKINIIFLMNLENIINYLEVLIKQI